MFESNDTGCDECGTGTFKLKVNSKYAADLQEKEKRKDLARLNSMIKSGEVSDDDDDFLNSEEEEEELSTEDEDAIEFTPDVHSKIDEIIQKIKHKDPSIYNKNISWFNDNDHSSQQSLPRKKKRTGEAANSIIEQVQPSVVVDADEGDEKEEIDETKAEGEEFLSSYFSEQKWRENELVSGFNYHFEEPGGSTITSYPRSHHNPKITAKRREIERLKQLKRDDVKMKMQAIKDSMKDIDNDVDDEPGQGNSSTSFNYAQVKPVSFGLKAIDILCTNDELLNQIKPLKHLAAPYDDKEMNHYNKGFVKKAKREMRFSSSGGVEVSKKKNPVVADNTNSKIKVSKSRLAAYGK